MGCFNFERVKVWIFKVFGRCFEPIGWDGDIVLPVPTSHAKYYSKPTMWDGDIRKSRKRLTKMYSFFCSKPTAWDGDFGREGRGSTLDPCSEPTVWDGDITCLQGLSGFHAGQGSKPTVWDGETTTS